MHSACGRWVLVFNGEIYNHLALRLELERLGASPCGGWRGQSDTESLLAAFAQWGFVPTLERLVGMFALALWDAQDHCLRLARDRIGEKPLYYGWQGSSFLFGSELKALCVHPDFHAEIDRQALAEYFYWNYIPAPLSIYRDIRKLSPGCWIELRRHEVRCRRWPNEQSYWSLARIARRSMERQFQGSFIDAVNEVETRLNEAVRLQSVADVPVGAFLSGGIDSSCVVAFMQRQAGARVTTFSIRMPDTRLDEADHASAVARHLGTEHIEQCLRVKDVLDLIPKLNRLWDEPFADSSQVPTYLVSRLARQHVTVALSGDGGDEFFLGYPQYRLFRALWRTRGLRRLPWSQVMLFLAPLSRTAGGLRQVNRVQRVLSAWQAHDPAALARCWANRYSASQVPLHDAPKYTGRRSFCPAPAFCDPASAAAVWHAEHYLPDDILVKVDRAAMGNGLETRAPLLDHRLVEFALSLPAGYRLRGRENKRVLREVLYRYVPRYLVDRPKHGFSIPLGNWLRKEMRSFAEDLLKKVSTHSYIDANVVKRIWDDHIQSRHDRSEQLWGLIVLGTFLDGV
jgi:asparagine synthase (glutamine-hydrolysing)